MADFTPKCPYCGSRGPLSFIDGPYCHGPDESSYFFLHKWKKCRECGTGWRIIQWVEEDEFYGLSDFDSVVKRWDDFPIKREYYFNPNTWSYHMVPKLFKNKYEEEDEKRRQEKQKEKLEELNKMKDTLFKKEQEPYFRDLFGNKIGKIWTKTTL